MAGYKVIQDVEAEDKFLGPLTFKQFLFAGGGAITGYVLFIFATKGIWVGVAFLAPIFLVFAVFAFPWSKDQPTELWLASRIRFLLVPRKRIWDQSGIKDLVEVTVPKREVKIYSDGLNHDQVYSRVNALASVVDTRGWAIKNYSHTQPIDDSDRLVVADTTVLPDDNQQILATAVDVMDEQNNPLADQFTNLMEQSEQKHKQDTLAMIEQARQSSNQKAAADDDIPLPKVADTAKAMRKMQKNVSAQDYSFLYKTDLPNDPNLMSFQSNVVVGPGANAPVIATNSQQPTIKVEDEQKLLKKVHDRQAVDAKVKQGSHLKTIQPIGVGVSNQGSGMSSGQGSGVGNQVATVAALSTSATPVDPAILSLSNNDDLSVETLARQAKKDLPDNGDEVVISLR